ncbi:MAG: septum formation initiator family protein [Phascolarctobacterium sp.]|nr:septum formation initiator family protein [Candidatus Phascolarctobacterium caballi]
MLGTKRKQVCRDRKILRYVVTVFLVICIASIGRQVWHLYELQHETSQTKIRIEKLKAEQEKLKSEKEKLHTSEYVEQIAREDYNMVGKNEVPIFIVDDEKMKEKTDSK